MKFRLLADENTSHRLVSSCLRLSPGFPIVHLANWRDGQWLGSDDEALLLLAASEKLTLVAFDRRTLAACAGQLNRAGFNHSGVILFRRFVRLDDFGYQARVLTEFWRADGSASDWENRIVYVPLTR